MRTLVANVMVLVLFGGATATTLTAQLATGDLSKLVVARAWSPQSLKYRAPSPNPGSTGLDATMRPSAGRTLLVVEVVLRGGAEARLTVADVKVVDAKKAAYEPVGAAGSIFANFEPFSENVAGWVRTFGPQGPTGPTVKIGREKQADPFSVELKGEGANVFFAFTIPANAGALGLALGKQSSAPLTVVPETP